MQPRRSDDENFDLRARVELGLAYDPQGIPGHLFRHTPWILRRGVRRILVAVMVAGAGLGALFGMRPPELVRGAIEHEYYERTLHGTFMDSQPLLRHLGLSQGNVVPGFPQLMRPCDIDGHLVYHLTTFFEKGGMVTVFAFDQPVALKEGSGWWDNVYWQVITSKDGKPLVMVSQKKAALAVARVSFGKGQS
jgi:hypothetical protein